VASVWLRRDYFLGAAGKPCLIKQENTSQASSRKTEIQPVSMLFMLEACKIRMI